jgi:hypothetical protein
LEDYGIENPEELEPLDIVRIYVEEPCPKKHHPENWQAADEPWEVVNTKLTVAGAKALVTAIQDGPDIFVSNGISLNYDELVQSPLLNSLTVVVPKDPYFYYKERRGKSNQARARFELGDNKYNLAITDTKFEKTILSESIEYSPELDSDEAMVFTISLTEPHGGDTREDKACYKLVAGIFTVPTKLLEK